jgi:hypothetical protein
MTSDLFIEAQKTGILNLSCGSLIDWPLKQVIPYALEDILQLSQFCSKPFYLKMINFLGLL